MGLSLVFDVMSAQPRVVCIAPVQKSCNSDMFGQSAGLYSGTQHELIVGAHHSTAQHITAQQQKSASDSSDGKTVYTELLQLQWGTVWREGTLRTPRGWRTYQ